MTISSDLTGPVECPGPAYPASRSVPESLQGHSLRVFGVLHFVSAIPRRSAASFRIEIQHDAQF
jgi:hypothetical protein